VYPQRMVSQALWLGLLATLVDLALSACGGEKQQQEPRPRPYRRTRKPCAPPRRRVLGVFSEVRCRELGGVVPGPDS
jgi:hypothetical protein